VGRREGGGGDGRKVEGEKEKAERGTTKKREGKEDTVSNAREKGKRETATY
jgi:hypothetical protein